jgi:hypothetical protein
VRLLVERMLGLADRLLARVDLLVARFLGQAP